MDCSGDIIIYFNRIYKESLYSSWTSSNRNNKFLFLIFSITIGQSLNTVDYNTYTVKQLDKIKTNTTEISNVDSIQVEYCDESRVKISYLKGIVKKTLLTDKNCVNIKKSPNDKKSIIKYTVKKKPQISDYLFWLPRIKKATIYVIYD